MSMIPSVAPTTTKPLQSNPSTGQPSTSSNALVDAAGGGDPAPGPGQTGATPTVSNYIGPAGYQLPDTYTTTGMTRGLADNYETSLSPQYRVGDELTPLKDSWPAERIADIQNQMVSAGLLKARNFQLGFWDQPTMSAYRELLGYSNVSGQDSDTTLANFKATIAKFGDTTTGAHRVRQPFLAELTDPNTLRDTLDAVSVRTMGRGLTEQEKAHFVDSFRATQEQSLRGKDDMAGDVDTTTGANTGTGGTYSLPQPESSANAYIKSTNPDAVKEYNYLNAFKAFEQLLSGSGL